MGARIVTALEVLYQHLKCYFSTCTSANLSAKKCAISAGFETGSAKTRKSTADVTERPAEISLTLTENSRSADKTPTDGAEKGSQQKSTN